MHMPRWLRRLAARFFAIGLLAATLFTVDSLASPSPAEARCTGVGNPVKSTFSYGGGVAASETPLTGTCNGNQLYSGVLKDERADGYCVSVQFKETGYEWGDYAVVCGNDNTLAFDYRDKNNNSRAYQRFCLYTAPPNSRLRTCGWGTQVGFGYYGTNWGY
jgi:hypothetical protein